MWNRAKVLTIHRPSGGAKQEVPDAWNPNPEGRTHVHLHQRPCRLPEVHAAAGPLRHPALHFPATDAGRLHAAGLYRPGLGLQVGQRYISPDQSGNCAVCVSQQSRSAGAQAAALFVLFQQVYRRLKSICLQEWTLRHSARCFPWPTLWCFY